MAVNVPTTGLNLNRRAFARGEPLIAGEAAGDIPYSLRGQVRQVNHTYAHRMPTIQSQGRPAADGIATGATEEIASTALAGGATLVLAQPYQVPQDVPTVRLVAVVEDLEVRLTDSAGSSAWSTFASPAGAGNREVHTVTRTLSAAGVDEVFSIEGRAVGGGTGKLYLVLIQPVPMVAANFPTAAPVVYDNSYLYREGERPAGIMPVLYNVEITRPTASTILIAPEDTNRTAFALLTDSGDNAKLVVIPTAGITWDITVAGLGGVRAGGEVVNTGYDLYLVSEAGGDNLNVIAEIHGTELTHAALAAVSATYTMMSRIISFGSNTQGGGGDLADFVQHDGLLTYKTDYADTSVVSGFTAIAVTALDVSDFVPTHCKRVTARLTVEDTNGYDFSVYQDAGGAEPLREYLTIDNAAGRNQEQHHEIPLLPTGNAMTAIVYIAWSTAASTGAAIEIREVEVF